MPARRANPFTAAVKRIVGAVHTTFADEEDFLVWIRSVSEDDAAGVIELTDLIYAINGPWIGRHLYDGDSDATKGMVAESVLQAIRLPLGAAHTSRFHFASSITNCLLNTVIRTHNKTAKNLNSHPAFQIAFTEDGLVAEPVFSDENRQYYDELVLRNMKRRPGNDPATVIQIKNAWAPAMRSVSDRLGRGKATPFSQEVVQEIAMQTGQDMNVVTAAMKKLTRSLRGLQEQNKDRLDIADLSDWLVDSGCPPEED